MVVAKIIQEITRLPEDEQGMVVEFVEALKTPQQVRTDFHDVTQRIV